MIDELLSLDPSIRSCGLGYWVDGVLRAVARVQDVTAPRTCDAHRARVLARGTAAWARTRALGAWDLVSEYPQAYAPGRGKGPTGDLIPMALVVGGVAAHCPGQVTTYLPAEWCRTLPKTEKGDPRGVPRGARIWDRLVTAEREVAEQHLQHDVWDAIGVGLHHLGRLSPRRGGKP